MTPSKDFMATAMLKNGPLSVGINANGMDYYEFGITGCEVCSTNHANPCSHHLNGMHLTLTLALTLAPPRPDDRRHRVLRGRRYR